MSYLYVSEQGAKIGVDGGYFSIHQRDGTIKKIPSETLECISIFGNIQVSTQAMQRILSKGIILNYYSTNGKYYGCLESTRHCNILRQRKQFAISEDKQFALGIAKQIVEAKIHNQLVVLERYIKNSTNEIEECVKQIRSAMKRISSATEIIEVSGYEGIAARYYFQGLSSVINPDFRFQGRNRMPPKDAFNSMLSLGYTFLMYEIYGSIKSKGLNPYVAFLHQDRERHPTLASDLMEEWRPIIVDSMVMSLVNGHEVQIDGFTADHETGGILLHRDTLKTFVKKYEQKMRTEVNYLMKKHDRVSYRRAIFLQVSSLTQAIEEDTPELYEPIKIR